jgi:hypothetical protein
MFYLIYVLEEVYYFILELLTTFGFLFGHDNLVIGLWKVSLGLLLAVLVCCAESKFK